MRSPETYGSLILMSGSFVFTDIGNDHGGGPVFDPVVKFVNRYRARPTRVADRIFVSCGVYEPLITPNRSMVPTFESTGMTMRFVETRDGHNWENWRDTPPRRAVVGVPGASEVRLRIVAGDAAGNAVLPVSDHLKRRRQASINARQRPGVRP